MVTDNQTNKVYFSKRLTWYKCWKELRSLPAEWVKKKLDTQTKKQDDVTLNTEAASCCFPPCPFCKNSSLATEDLKSPAL